MKTHTSIIINVPHASTYIPGEELPYFCVEKLEREILYMTDHFCDDIFDHGYEMVRFPISRLVCDFERFRDDREEVMAKQGMGACYISCSDRTVLRRLTSEHREEILQKYYDTYHRVLTLAVEEKLGQFGRCIIIDGHSFSAVPLPYELDQNPDRPDICIGTDPFHTPSELTHMTRDYFEQKGYTVAINAPFSGTMVPMKYYRKEPNVSSLMLEINRKLYMDPEGNPHTGYLNLKQQVGDWLEGIRTFALEDKQTNGGSV